MTANPQQMRIEGIYAQKEENSYMLRVKVPGGVLSAEQALKVCEIGERFGRDQLHLTTRNSIEFHGLPGEILPEAVRLLASVGLTTRGACGGAVRGVTCSTASLVRFPEAQALARKIHGHFTQNPHFEGLPKKFKVCVEAGYEGSRHLIQDVGVVFAGTADGEARYDVWTAGGLGKEPSPAFLLEREVTEGRVIALIEAIVRVYKAEATPGKRLKHVVARLGRQEVVELFHKHLEICPSLEIRDGFGKHLTPGTCCVSGFLETGIFAGEIDTVRFRKLAEIAVRHTDGWLVLTPNQNVAFIPETAEQRAEAEKALVAAGFLGDAREERVLFRVCPGNHECRMGLGPTRDVARLVLERMTDAGACLSWAISGCHNSCAQPQLADVGIVISKLPKDDSGTRLPLFDLYRRTDCNALGVAVQSEKTLEELLEAVSGIS